MVLALADLSRHLNIDTAFRHSARLGRTAFSKVALVKLHNLDRKTCSSRPARCHGRRCGNLVDTDSHLFEEQPGEANGGCNRDGD